MKYVAAVLAVAAALVAVASAQCVTPDCDQDVLKVYTLSRIDYGISEDFEFGSNTNTNTADRKANRAAPARPAKLKGPQGAAAATAPAPAPAPATAPATAATAPAAAAVPTAPAAAPVTSASESGATQAGNATLFNTNTAALPAGINAFPTDSCQSFFNILSAFSYYDYNANEGFLSDNHLPCLGRISTINFAYEDTRKHSATFEIKSSADGVAPLVWSNNNNYYNNYNTGARAQYSINTASSLPHPYVTPFSKVGIDSFVMNGIKFNVNQRTVLTPAVFDAASAANNANGYGGGGCARIRHHSFYVEGKGDNGDGGVELFYIEVVVQETTVPY